MLIYSSLILESTEANCNQEKETLKIEYEKRMMDLNSKHLEAMQIREKDYEKETLAKTQVINSLTSQLRGN